MIFLPFHQLYGSSSRNGGGEKKARETCRDEKLAWANYVTPRKEDEDDSDNCLLEGLIDKKKVGQ